MAAEQRAQEAAARAALPQNFDAKCLGQGKPNGGGPAQRQKRVEFLDRMWYLYPLPVELEQQWPAFRAAWPNWVGRTHGSTVGSFLADKMKDWEKQAKAGKTSRFPAFVKQQLQAMPALGQTVKQAPHKEKATTATS